MGVSLSLVFFACTTESHMRRIWPGFLLSPCQKGNELLLTYMHTSSDWELLRPKLPQLGFPEHQWEWGHAKCSRGALRKCTEQSCRYTGGQLDSGRADRGRCCKTLGFCILSQKNRIYSKIPHHDQIAIKKWHSFAVEHKQQHVYFISSALYLVVLGTLTQGRTPQW